MKSQDKLENRNKNIDVAIFKKGYENSFCQLLVSSRMAVLLIPQHDLQHAAEKSQHIKMNKTKYNKKLWFHIVKLFMEKSNILYWRFFMQCIHKNWTFLMFQKRKKYSQIGLWWTKIKKIDEWWMKSWPKTWCRHE